VIFILFFLGDPKKSDFFFYAPIGAPGMDKMAWKNTPIRGGFSHTTYPHLAEK